MSKSTDKTGKTAVTKDVNMDLSIGTRVDVKGGTHDGKTGTIKKVNDQKPRVLLDDGTEVNIDKKHLVISQTAASSSSDPETRIFELEAQVDLQAQEMAAQAREIERLNALLAQIKVAASSSDVVPKAEDDDL
jgi:ribosomal protein L24